MAQYSGFEKRLGYHSNLTARGLFGWSKNSERY